MDKRKLKILRTEISIPIKEAVELLRKNNGNVLACKNDFHNNNVEKIIGSTGCKKEVANDFYTKYNCDITKAISKINDRQIVFTTSDFEPPQNAIGFTLWAENSNGEIYKTVKRNDIFIPTSDFNYIIEEVKAVSSESFSICGYNYFDQNESKILIKKIEAIKSNNLKVEAFLKKVKEWFIDKLQHADFIVISGNL